MINILITGANGQLGSEIKVIADNSSSSFNFIYTDVNELNITDFKQLESFFKENNINYIVNCAAYTNVDKAEEDYDNAFKINVGAVNNLARVAEQFKAKIIHISTDYVFDSCKQNVPFKEEDKTFSVSAYGSTKLRGELELQQSTNYMIIRTSWLYSFFGHNFVKTMLRLGKEKDELGVVFDQVSTPTYAADLANVVLKIIDYSEKSNIFKTGIYHFSNEGVCSWYDFAVEIMKKANLKCKVKPIETHDYPLPAKRPPYSVMNKEKIKDTFQIEIPHWTESLDKCLGLLVQAEDK